MFESFKNYVKDGLNQGFKIPLAKEGVEGKPSATLWFAYISFFLALASEVYFIYKGDPLASTATAICFWVLAMVFYRLRKLDSVKIDLDNHSIELDGDDEDSTEPSKE